MSGSAGLWPIGPAAKPANPAPPPTRTSSASTGTILAHGFPCMSTNMAKKNATPSDSALARSSLSTSDTGTLRLIVAAVRAAGQVRLQPGLIRNFLRPSEPIRQVGYEHESGQCSLERHDGASVRRAKADVKMAVALRPFTVTTRCVL